MLVDYAGAGARLDPERGIALDADQWGWQAKVDGCYVRVATDRRGAISSLLTRAGAPIAHELVGVRIGLPDAVLAAELEAHTEAGERAAALRGWRNLHVFDAASLRGSRIADRPYLERHAMLADDLEAARTVRDERYVVDDQGDAHDRAGRYARPVPRDARRVELVELVRGRDEARALWRSHIEVGGGEGLVAVRLDARLGARGAKRKIKATDSIDAVVVSVDRGAAVLEWRGHRFAVSARGKVCVRVGDIAEVRHDGWYERSVTPRFARLVRVRSDLTGSRAA